MRVCGPPTMIPFGGPAVFSRTTDDPPASLGEAVSEGAGFVSGQVIYVAGGPRA